MARVTENQARALAVLAAAGGPGTRVKAKRLLVAAGWGDWSAYGTLGGLARPWNQPGLPPALRRRSRSEWELLPALFGVWLPAARGAAA